MKKFTIYFWFIVALAMVGGILYFSATGDSPILPTYKSIEDLFLMAFIVIIALVVSSCIKRNNSR